MAARRISSLLSSSLASSSSLLTKGRISGVGRVVSTYSTSSSVDNPITPSIKVNCTQVLTKSLNPSGKTFPTYDPRTGDVIAHISEGDAKDIDATVSAARKAFDEGPWPRMTAYERVKVLFQFADLLDKHTEELSTLETWDNGKPLGRQGWACPSMWLHHRSQVCRADTFVCSFCSQATSIVILGGNRFHRLDFLQVLNVVSGFGSTTGAALSSHMEVDKLAFTGSSDTEKIVLAVSVNEFSVLLLFLEVLEGSCFSLKMVDLQQAGVQSPVNTTVTSSSYGSPVLSSVQHIPKQDVIKLTESTYLLWKHQIEENPVYIVHRQQDKSLALWLLTTVSMEVLPHLTGLTSARTIWNAVSRLFGVRSSAKISSLRHSLHSQRKAGLTVSDYLAKIKTVCDLLNVAGCDVPEQKQVSVILAGLSMEFESIIAIASRDVVSLDSLTEMLLNCEARQKAFLSDVPVVWKVGHIIQRCYRRFDRDFTGVANEDQSAEQWKKPSEQIVHVNGHAYNHTLNSPVFYHYPSSSMQVMPYTLTRQGLSYSSNQRERESRREFEEASTGALASPDFGGKPPCRPPLTGGDRFPSTAFGDEMTTVRRVSSTLVGIWGRILMLVVVLVSCVGCYGVTGDETCGRETRSWEVPCGAGDDCWNKMGELGSSRNEILCREVEIELEALTSSSWIVFWLKILRRPLRREVEPRYWISFVVKLKSNVSCVVSRPTSFVVKLKLALEPGNCLLTTSRPFVVKLNLCCLESNILRCEVELGSEIEKLVIDNQRGPFVVKLNLRCLESNILRCEVEIGSEIVKLVIDNQQSLRREVELTFSPFVVKLNLRCLESNILRCEVEIGSEIEKLFVDNQRSLRREVELALSGVQYPSLGIFAVKLNLRCLEWYDILRRGVAIAGGPFVVKLSLDLNILRREVEIQVLYVAGGHDSLRREVETVETSLL
ncbi:hypothetical protein F3Y22_tig00112344pilonHSYRG00309 [Hibiscus syriacus]|uniref:Aldehyde dehydrogenase domain-containing protein n=1 Tax=Hibiscus syriacus TaxID=106335 RepID=A0A6A2X1D4_HIBSY|nr:hypothetical protein F3Y22_tig00112344pilonHSYRG00309 [Hibiscus syriacus]